MREANKNCRPAIELSDPDVIAAMKDLHGYIDITPKDFREIFHIAYKHALQRIQKSLQAGDIMSTPAFCIPLDMEVVTAARLLADKGFSGAPVIDEAGKLVGVFSEKDFLSQMGMHGQSSFLQVIAHCLENKECMAAILRGKLVQKIMSSPAISASSEITVAEISVLFTEKNINRLPIIDENARPVGIVTRSNLVQSYCLLNESSYPALSS